MSRPTILVCSGPKATIAKTPPLLTSTKARSADEGGEDARFDTLVPQYLEEPVDVKIRRFSAHPMEEDAAEVYHDTGEAYDEVTLRPEDGPYPLPYVARRDDGSERGTPFDPDDVTDPDIDFGGRQFFYPDASRIFEEIDRGVFGRERSGEANILSKRAEYDFIRPLPPAGYTSEGEVRGRDFFPYKPREKSKSPRLRDLATAVNAIQSRLDSGDYDGVLWLEGSPRLEETIYWLSLLLDTDLPVVGTVANRTHGQLSNDGDRNIVDAVDYIRSDLSGGLGAVVVQDQVIYAAREFKKQDARPGGFEAVGGQGGILGTVKSSVHIQYRPNYRHTSTSAVSVSELPERVAFVDCHGDDEVTELAVTDDREVLGSAVPRVSIVKQASYSQLDRSEDPDEAVGLMARVEQAREEREGDNPEMPSLHGIVFEGTSSYGQGNRTELAAMSVAAHSGIPVVRVGRSDPGGFIVPDHGGNYPTVEGGNLDANKARLLLMASLLKLGRLPRAADPRDPSDAETDAVMDKLSEFQDIFDSH
jgi:L-asparaginase